MRNIMKKSIIFLGAFLLLSGWVIRDNVFAYSPVDLYDNVWRLINSKFVDQSNNQQNWAKWRHKYDNQIRTNEDAYVAINTMVASLNDPYTKFLDPKEFADETSSIKGSLKGIGIQIGVKDGKLMVIAPIEDTPAERAGLQADDEILEIDGASTKGITVDKAADKIRGKEGTQVTLLVKRKDVAPKTYTITRAEIEIKSISQKLPTDMTIPNDFCYIRLSSFISRNAATEFGNILNTNRNKKGFIIDLRSNPGGLLTNAIYISDMFLDGGTIVSTVDRDGYKETQRASAGVYTKKPVVVLINKGSASASEIFSGAMKDNHRAVIIGEQSFGKGLVQEINKLPYESGINITIQKYLTPNGTDINKKGITPDIVVKLTEDDVKNKNDLQLKKAVEVLSKMTSGQSIAIY
ncbi:c-terminal processing peptidase-2 Serine peptidase MEROPS family S41A [Clostridium sp. CAG:715]|nr:c-terminal processing peptidase-2 Serine peptidase MEROPS family S41A [Clostridium sp. CAG:715]